MTQTIDQEIADLHSAAYELYAKAALGEEARDFTPAEQSQFEDLMGRKATLEKRRANQQARAQRLAGFEAQLGTLPARSGPGPVPPVAPGQGPQDARSLGRQFVESSQYAEFARAFPSGVPDGVHAHIAPVMLPARTLTAGIGRKAGEITTGLFPMPAQLFSYPELMLPWMLPLNITALVTHSPCSTDAVQYPELKTYAHAAAVVPEGTAKPQATAEWQLVTVPVKTYAEWIAVSKQALADRGQLSAMIDTFLRQGVNQALENDITADLLAKAPTMAAPTGTPTLFDRARHAITQLQRKGVTPNAFVFTPEDEEAIDIAKDTLGRYFSAGPFGMGPGTLWGIRRVVAYYMAGTNIGLVGDFRFDIFFDREQDAISASDSHADFFVKNLVAVLGEARGVNAVTYPNAFLQFATPASTFAAEAEAETPPKQPEQPKPVTTGSTARRP